MTPQVLPILSSARIDAASASATALVGFVVLLFVLLGILRHGKPRESANVIVSDPPVRDTESPAHRDRCARAAAAAVILHRIRYSTGDLNEEG